VGIPLRFRASARTSTRVSAATLELVGRMLTSSSSVALDPGDDDDGNSFAALIVGTFLRLHLGVR